MTESTELFAGQERSELGLGNRLVLDDAKLRANTRLIQARNDIEVANETATLEGWELFDAATTAPRICPHFSVEMETGTGKTYVYLRTVFELSKRYGFKKFIVVVPSVAIREGVLKNIEITARPQPMKRLQIQLLVGFGGNEAGRRPLHSLGHGMSISEVILLPLPKRLCIRGRNLLHIMAKRGKLAIRKTTDCSRPAAMC
jgi:hypothetical protein